MAGAIRMGYEAILYYGTAGSTAATQVTNCVDLDYDVEQALKLARRLEHMARWTAVRELTNPGSGLEGAVRLEVQRITGRSSVRAPAAW